MGSVKRKRNVDNGQEQAKKNKESDNETEAITVDQKITKLPIAASPWLENFLSQKRDSIVTAADEHDVADDTYLREFSLQFTKTIPEDTGDDSDNESQPIKSELCEIEQMSMPEQTESQIGDRDVEDVSLAASAKLKLFNLPYRIKSKEIVDLFSKYGFPDVTITMDIDKRTSLPAGSASVDLVPGTDVAEAVKALHGQNCGGRPLKVLSQKAVLKKSRPSGGRADRYFLGVDVVSELKCNSCGKGGHKAADCDVGLVHPCHLCAARDHESGDCPNITCFRCGEFGHHSKSCNNARRSSRAFICTLCASSTHDARNCLQIPEKAQARLEDSCIRCMRCNKLGHALCGQETMTEKKKKSKGIFCPNCGEDGHHVDYPNDSSRAGSIVGGLNVCQAPRYDAYLKFPQLLRNIDRICSGGDRDVQTDYYQSLVWSAGSGEQVQRMFPSLCRTKSSGEHDMRRKTMSASDFSSSRNYSNNNAQSSDSMFPSSSTYCDSPSAERDGSRRGYNGSLQPSSSSRRHSGYDDSSSRNQDRQRDSREYNGRRVMHDDVPYTDRNDGRRRGGEAQYQPVFHDSLPRRASISNYDNSRDSGRIARRY